MAVPFLKVPQTFRRPAQPPRGFTPLPPISTRFENGDAFRLLFDKSSDIANPDDPVVDMVGVGRETIVGLFSWPGYELGGTCQRREVFKLFTTDGTPKTRADLARWLSNMIVRVIDRCKDQRMVEENRKECRVFEIRNDFKMVKNTRVGSIVNTDDGKWHAEVEMVIG
ncbi:hypothetical protein DFH11DRAFT_1590686 [Phellopilus nigrolimitatus]|nr:hypothetical protein DFH11DRAFT_1611339 [Phellopilus nigrolimitatus]KAH8114959.1 hypothetical protein DFH11DRAFT_1590686 [Phellopilus nigrolimitatus]